MNEDTIRIGDSVAVAGKEGIGVVVIFRSFAEPRFLVQFGADAARREWVTTGRISLVARAGQDNEGPQLIPERGILDW